MLLLLHIVVVVRCLHVVVVIVVVVVDAIFPFVPDNDNLDNCVVNKMYRCRCLSKMIMMLNKDKGSVLECTTENDDHHEHVEDTCPY